MFFLHLIIAAIIVFYNLVMIQNVSNNQYISLCGSCQQLWIGGGGEMLLYGK